MTTPITLIADCRGEQGTATHRHRYRGPASGAGPCEHNDESAHGKGVLDKDAKDDYGSHLFGAGCDGHGERRGELGQSVAKQVDRECQQRRDEDYGETRIEPKCG